MLGVWVLGGVVMAGSSAVEIDEHKVGCCSAHVAAEWQRPAHCCDAAPLHLPAHVLLLPTALACCCCQSPPHLHSATTTAGG